ncbi:hypothetical protein D3C76_1761330 [compost metagenome]
MTLFVDADQHWFEARAIEGVDNILRRLQRHFVLCRAPAKDYPYTQFSHRLASW